MFGFLSFGSQVVSLWIHSSFVIFIGVGVNTRHTMAKDLLIYVKAKIISLTQIKIIIIAAIVIVIKN